MKKYKHLLIVLNIVLVARAQPQMLKDVYKNDFLTGTAVTPANTSGSGKAALINSKPGDYNFDPANDYAGFGENTTCLLLAIYLFGITSALNYKRNENMLDNSIVFIAKKSFGKI